MIYALVIYILLCLFVAALGTRRKFGFWGYFFASLLFSPLIGIIMVFGSEKRPRERYTPGGAS